MWLGSALESRRTRDDAAEKNMRSVVAFVLPAADADREDDKVRLLFFNQIEIEGGRQRIIAGLIHLCARLPRQT